MLTELVSSGVGCCRVELSLNVPALCSIAMTKRVMECRSKVKWLLGRPEKDGVQTEREKEKEREQKA